MQIFIFQVQIVNKHNNQSKQHEDQVFKFYNFQKLKCKKYVI